MQKVFGTARDFALQMRLDKEHYGYHYPEYVYWQRYFTGPETAAAGATSAPATRTFTWVGGDVSNAKEGSRLRIPTGPDCGEYEIVTVAPGGDITKLVVSRDWPAGNETDVSFHLEFSDLYGDALPTIEDRFVQRPDDVPFYLNLEVPKQDLTTYGFDESADGVAVFSRALHAVAPYDFSPKEGDIFQGVDGMKYEILAIKKYDWVGVQHDHWLHWLASVQRCHRDIPTGGVPDGTL